MAFPILVSGSSMALLLMKICETNPSWDLAPQGYVKCCTSSLLSPIGHKVICEVVTTAEVTLRADA